MVIGANGCHNSATMTICYNNRFGGFGFGEKMSPAISMSSTGTYMKLELMRTDWVLEMHGALWDVASC